MKIAEIRKYVLLAIAALLAVSLWNAWEKEQKAHTLQQVQQQQVVGSSSQSAATSTSYTPAAYQGAKATQRQSLATSTKANLNTISAPGQLVKVQTDDFDIGIDLKSGNLVNLALKQYPVSLKQKNVPFVLLNTDKASLYVAQSGLISAGGKPMGLQFQASQDSYTMQPGQDQLMVTLDARTANGLDVKKIYTFKRNDYLIHVSYQIHNTGANAWTGSFYGQSTRRPVKKHGMMIGSRSYNGVSISSKAKPYEKLKYDWLGKNMLSRSIEGGWVAVQQQYFLTAWIPNKNTMNHYYSHTTFSDGSDDSLANAYTVGVITPQLVVKPGQMAQVGSSFYAGPEIAKTLKAIAPGLDLSIDYGWLFPLSKAIFWIMEHIHQLIGNWGWSIVLVTLLIKLVFYKFSESSYRSMGKMRELQPKLQKLKERFGDDKAKLSQATMELYKKEKVNPAGGCLPMLIQIPFFIALYYVLIESVQLRQAPFIFWIHDLALKDPYYVLPILMGLSMLVQQKMTPSPMDPAQAKAMMILPVVFTAMFLNFPAGLTLYWLTNNVLTIGQQWFVMHRTEKLKNKPAKAKKLK